MQVGRSYGEACGVSAALDMAGERWALLVIRELLLGPRRFTDLRNGLPTISANVLTQRLEGLEAAGLLARRQLPPPSGAQVYELTEAGRAGEPAVLALAAWGWQAGLVRRGRSVSAAALATAMRVLFDAERAKGFKAVVELHLGPERLVASVRKGRFEIAAAEARSHVVLTGSPSAVLEAIGAFGPDAADGSDALAIDGDAAAAERFLTLFPRPAVLSRQL